mmetsp:Transcript_6825/g.20714  ORF Transcript_6825/g.20714 Transcript_6825/m.20714 type:complete len:509 (-) Transcript_6825:1927-3453(-)
MQHMRRQEKRREVGALGLRSSEVEALLLVAESRVDLGRGEARGEVARADEFTTLTHGSRQLVGHVRKKLVHLGSLRPQSFPALQADQHVATDLELAAAVHPLADGVGRLGLEGGLDHDRDAKAQLVLGERRDRTLEREDLGRHLLRRVDLADVQVVLLGNADVGALGAAGPVGVPRGHLRRAAVEATEHLLDGLLVVIVLDECLLLLAAQLQCGGQHGVVVVRAVLAVGRIDDQGVEALCLSLAEHLCTDVPALAVEIMVVDVDDGRGHAALLEHRRDGLHMPPNCIGRPIGTLAWVLDPQLLQLQAAGLKQIDLTTGPLLQCLQGEFWREDPVGHRDAPGLQQFAGGLILRRVALRLIDEVARVEIIRMPRHPCATHANAGPVVVGDNLGCGIEKRLADGSWQLGQAIDVLRALQRVRGHVVRQAELHDHGRVEASDEARLVLRPTDLVAHAAGPFSPDLRVLPGDVGHRGGLGIVALLRCVARCDGDPATSLLVKLTSQLLDVVFV